VGKYRKVNCIAKKVDKKYNFLSAESFGK
jgi:hypothetical protein